MKTKLLILVFICISTLVGATNPNKDAERRKAEEQLSEQIKKHLEGCVHHLFSAVEEVEITFTINDSHKVMVSQVKTDNALLRRAVAAGIHGKEVFFAEILEHQLIRIPVRFH